MVDEREVIKKTEEYMQSRLAGDSSGHDWFHTDRVRNLGRRIATSEHADLYVVELACLLHDVADYKLHEGDLEIGPRTAYNWLTSLSVHPSIASYVRDIVSQLNFKSPCSKNSVTTLEGQCVQDADFLDAMGAIGIARCFAFGGYKGNVMHDPSVKPNLNKTEAEYRLSNATQINHFYEKLLLLRTRMNTPTGRKIAEERHRFMQEFIDRFLLEWDGKA